MKITQKVFYSVSNKVVKNSSVNLNVFPSRVFMSLACFLFIDNLLHFLTCVQLDGKEENGGDGEFLKVHVYIMYIETCLPSSCITPF